MTTKTKAAAAVLLASLGLASGGCLYVETNGGGGRYAAHHTVTSDEMDYLVRQSSRIRLGDERNRVLDLFPEESISLWSSDTIEGHEVEEWRIRAYSRRDRTVFNRYLYFVDGELAAHDRDQLDYRSSGRVLDWTRR